MAGNEQTIARMVVPIANANANAGVNATNVVAPLEKDSPVIIRLFLAAFTPG